MLRRPSLRTRPRRARAAAPSPRLSDPPINYLYERRREPAAL